MLLILEGDFMQSYTLKNHIVFIVSVTKELEYLLGIPKQNGERPLLLTIKEYETVTDTQKLDEFSKTNHSIFIIPILPQNVIERLKRKEMDSYQQSFYHIAQCIRHSETILKQIQKNYTKPYQITTFLPDFTHFLETQFALMEKMQKMQEDKVDSTSFLANIPKQSEELLAYQEEKNKLLALRGQLLSTPVKEEDSSASVGKRKSFATKTGQIYRGPDPDGFVDIFLLCIITLFVTLGTMVSVIIVLS